LTLHPLVLAELLAAEADVARERLAGRVDSVSAEGDHVVVSFRAHDQLWRLRLDGAEYDAKPLAVSVVDDAGATVGVEAWPPGLAYGGDHPFVHRPWVCIRGTFEYHTYPGHTADGWERYRGNLRLPDVVSHLLEKVGV